LSVRAARPLKDNSARLVDKRLNAQRHLDSGRTPYQTHQAQALDSHDTFGRPLTPDSFVPVSTRAIHDAKPKWTINHDPIRYHDLTSSAPCLILSMYEIYAILQKAGCG
jgi:hypothetical protein